MNIKDLDATLLGHGRKFQLSSVVHRGPMNHSTALCRTYAEDEKRSFYHFLILLTRTLATASNVGHLPLVLRVALRPLSGTEPSPDLRIYYVIYHFISRSAYPPL
jgi:hypothetical protein